jgi:hypothetical protein
MMEYPLYNFQQLGFVDLVRTDVMSKCAGKNGMYHAHLNSVCILCYDSTFFVELVQMLVQTSNSPPLELVCHVSTDLFKDTFEEEAIKQQGTSNPRFKKMAITEHLMCSASRSLVGTDTPRFRPSPVSSQCEVSTCSKPFR